MSLQYKSLLSTAREDANRRMQSKGLSVGRNRSRFIDEDDDVDEKIGGLVPRRDKDLLSDKSTDFLSTLFGNIIEEGKKMLEDEPPGPPGDADSRFLITEELPTGESAGMVEVTDNEKNKSTAQIIANFENNNQSEYKAYWDGKRYAIGFGTRATSEDEVISYEEAMTRLENSTAQAKKDVVAMKKQHGYEWNENQIAALTSFTYNLGKGGLVSLTENGTRGDEEISEMMLEYDMAGKKKLPGLTKRRELESNLFTSE